MSPNRLQSGRAAVMGLLAAVGLAGCARVTPEQLQTELTAVRSEMTTADSALSGRITATDGRVTALTSRLDSLERDLQALRTEFNASIQRMETAVRFNVPVHFDFDDATVRESDRDARPLRAGRRQVLHRFDYHGRGIYRSRRQRQL